MGNDRDVGRAHRGPQAADAPPAAATPTGPGDGRRAAPVAGADEPRWRRLGKLLIDRVPAAAQVRRWLAKLPVDRLPPAVRLAAKATPALVALVVALDLLGALQATTHGLVERRWIGPTKQPSKWIKAARQAPTADTVIRRLMTFQLDRDTLTVTYDLWLPAEHNLFKAVQDGQANSTSAWLVHDVLGDVRVGQFPQGLPNSRRTWQATLSFDPPVAETTTTEGHLRLTSKPYSFSLPALQVSVDKPAALNAPVGAGEPRGLRLTSDLAVVRADRLQVSRQQGPAPVWQTSERAEFDRLGSDQVLRFTVTKPGASGLRSALFGMGGASLPVLDGLQGRLTVLLVTIALLLWLQAAGKRLGRLRPLADIVRATFVYVLALAVVGAIADASWSLAWYPRPLATRLVPGIGEPKLVGAFALTIVAAAMLWPLTVARTHRRLSEAGPAEVRPQTTATRTAGRATAIDNGEPRPATADQGHVVGALEHRPANAAGSGQVRGSRRAGKALDIAAVAITAAWIPLAAAEEPLRHRGTLALTIVALVVAAHLLSGYLATTLVGGPQAWTVATAATLTGVGVGVAFPVFGYVYSDKADAARVAIFVAVAVVLVVAYAVYAATATRFLATDVGRRERSSWLAAAVLLGLLVVTIPDVVGVAVDPSPGAEVGPWSLFGLADSLTGVSLYLLLACLMVALRWLGSADWEGADRLLVRRAGILFAVLTFYWFGERWFWVPISLLLGWLVAATVAFPRDGSAADTTWFTKRVLEVTSQLRASLDLLDANRAKLAEQFRKGDIDHAEFGGKVQSLDRARRVASRHVSDLGDDGNDPGRLRERLRPGGWRHAVPAAWWGLVLGSPWIVLYLWQIGSVPVAPTDYEALDFGAGTAGWIVLQWPLYGFFFGYFYPRLRGHSGVAKALTVFVTVVLPPVAYHALVGQRSDWQAYGIFALQMLLFCLLLGALAGDYLLLRRVGLGWRQMVDVHNLRFVLTVGSSIAVASGGLMLTILSTGLSAVVSALLEQAGISTPNAPTPMDLRR